MIIYNKSANKGMTTIEACLILPISFVLVFFSVWTAFYYYNESVFTKATESAALEGCRYPYLNNEEILEKASAEFKKEIKDKLIFMKTPDPVITVDINSVTVEARGEFDMSYIFFDRSMSDKAVYMIDVTHSASRIKPSVFLRTVNALKDVHRDMSESDDKDEILIND